MSLMRCRPCGLQTCSNSLLGIGTAEYEQNTSKHACKIPAVIPVLSCRAQHCHPELIRAFNHGMDVASATAETILRVFTACTGDTRNLLLDVRPNKDFKKKHVLLAYNIRLAANGKTLLVKTCRCHRACPH